VSEKTYLKGLEIPELNEEDIPLKKPPLRRLRFSEYY
jgi:hypothetical protein